jgi:hypothetical protein
VKPRCFPAAMSRHEGFCMGAAGGCGWAAKTRMWCVVSRGGAPGRKLGRAWA